MDHDPLSRVATQAVLKFMESLRVSKKLGLKNVGKIYKHEVPTFFRKDQVADENEELRRTRKSQVSFHLVKPILSTIRCYSELLVFSSRC